MALHSDWFGNGSQICRYGMKLVLCTTYVCESKLTETILQRLRPTVSPSDAPNWQFSFALVDHSLGGEENKNACCAATNTSFSRLPVDAANCAGVPRRQSLERSTLLVDVLTCTIIRGAA